MWLLCAHSSISRPSFFSKYFWCHWNISVCLLDCLLTSIAFNDIPTRFFFPPSSTLSIYHQPAIIQLPFWCPVIIGTSRHYHIYWDVLLPSESIFILIYYFTLESLPELTWSLLYPEMYLTHPRWHRFYLLSLFFCWSYSFQVWLLCISQMQHFCLWYLKGQWSYWNWNYYLQVC